MLDFVVQLYCVQFLIVISVSFRCAVPKSAGLETFLLLCQAQRYSPTYLIIVFVNSSLRTLMRDLVGYRHVGLNSMVSRS